MSNKIYTVRLADDTVGTINDNTLDGQPASAFMGETVTVHLNNENGDQIEVDGVLVEILEENTKH